MKRLRVAAVGAVALLTTVVFGAGTMVQAHQQQSNQSGAAAIGGLIDVAVNDVNVLNNSPLLNGSTVNIVNLNNVLNGNETNILSGILNNSNVLSQNTVVVQDFLNHSLDNNTILRDFLNNNNVNVSHVVAIDLLSAPVTIYTFQPR